MARRLGADPFDLANLIQFESGWNPKAVNPTSGATGLIQFMKFTAKSLGTTTAKIKRMSTAQQLPLVERYLRPYKGKLGTTQAVNMAVFYPKAMTWSPNKQFPRAVQKANPGIKTPADYVRWVTRKARLRSAGQIAIRGAKWTAALWVLGGSLLGAYLLLRRSHDPKQLVDYRESGGPW